MLTPFGSFLKTVSEVFLVFLLVFLDSFIETTVVHSFFAQLKILF